MTGRRSREDPARLADEELVVLAQRGDERAFEAIYDRHARVAFSLAYRLLGDRQGAEDLVQETFLAVWRLAGSYSPSRGSVRTWLLAILHNRGIDRLRTMSAMSRRQEALEREEALRGGPDASEEAIGRAEAGRMRAALAGLPREQLDVIRLAYYGGFTHQEISQMLEVPLGTVKSRMTLGMQRIRRQMVGPEVAGT
jgi:RNA polymerase sigma-70 factor (ECF subfamily)